MDQKKLIAETRLKLLKSQIKYLEWLAQIEEWRLINLDVNNDEDEPDDNESKKTNS